MEKKRSIGVTIFGYLTLICAVWWISNIIRIIVTQGEVESYESMPFYLIGAIINIALSVGILKLKNWARLIFLWLFGIGSIGMFLGGLWMGGDNLLLVILSSSIFLLPGALFIYFFTRPKVREQFK